jgi:putative sterol carrier protein
VTRPTVHDTPAEVEAIVRSLPARLRPEKVEGWGGRFHLVLTGDPKPEWTVTIDEGACHVEEGLAGEPACVLTMPAKTYVAVETGKKNPMAAFLAGRIKITNVGQMRRYDKAFWKLYEPPMHGEASPAVDVAASATPEPSKPDAR